MQKINRAELAKSAVAGGCCKTCCTTTAAKTTAAPVKSVSKA
jgi:hypothetical protein